MQRWLRLILVAALAGVGLYAAYYYLWLMPGAPPNQSPYSPKAELDAPSLFVNVCAGCHTAGRSGVDFDNALATRIRRRDRETWEKVVDALQSYYMPPVFHPQLTEEERAKLIGWAEQQLAAASRPVAEFGSNMVRRLHRSEYVHAVRDLFGIRFQPADDFPPNGRDWEYGSSAPVVPEEFRSAYQAAADRVLVQAALLRSEDDWYAEGPDAGGFDAMESESRHLSELHRPTPGTEAACARAILAGMARRAYRRPATAAEIEVLTDAFAEAVDAGARFHDGIDVACKLLLTAPQFLYVVETLPTGPSGAPQSADPFALASRLALFLWNSVPDEELLELAGRGVLHDQLPQQVRRMLKHRRARDFADHFADQWLELSRLTAVSGADAELVSAMRQETLRFVEHIIHEDRSVLEFLDADYTFLNVRLARHYGIAGVYGDAMRCVSTAGTPRGGLLTQASILALTSFGGSVTSPVQRGKWVLTNILDTPPPAPPAGLLEAFANGKKDFPRASGRKLLELHRFEESCAHCHNQLDGHGLALENFDAAGRWRTRDHEFPIDAAVTLPSGESFNGPVEFKAYLRGQKELFIRCLAGKLLGCALDRGLGDADRAALAPAADRVAAAGCRFSSLVVEVVRSQPFQIGTDLREQ